jgi:hypothetical protein
MPLMLAYASVSPAQTVFRTALTADHLQGGRSAYTVATTSNFSCGLNHTNITAALWLPLFRTV